MPDYLNWIGGEWMEAHAVGEFPNRNPASGETLHTFADATAADVDAAVAAARAAQPAWANTPAPRRAEILFRVAEISVRRKEELARDLVLEMGKVMPEALGDIQEGIDMTYFMAGEGRRLAGQTVPSESAEKFAASVRMPVGVVGAITPWNFPFAIPTWKIMPALVAGNSVVFKPSEYAPKCAWNLCKILEEAGLPPGVLNFVVGQGAEPGAALVDHAGIDLISFTGSTSVGKHVGVRCAETGKTCHLEMGGKNAIIVLVDADLELAVQGVTWSAFGSSGQRCTAASRVIVERAVVEEFSRRLIDAAQQLTVGSGLEAGSDLGPIINPVQLKKVEGYMAVGEEEGAVIACGGQVATVPEGEHGYWFEPTVFVNARPEMRIAQEEIFGPVTAIIPAEDLDDAIAIANAVPYGLSTAVYTQDVSKAFRALQGLTTGLVYVNAGTIGAEIHLPFGGTRGTGNGHREAGLVALDTYTEWKTIYVDFSGRLQRAQIDVE